MNNLYFLAEAKGSFTRTVNVIISESFKMSSVQCYGAVYT